MSTSEALEIEFPIMRYDVTLPLFDGRVDIEGVKLKPTRIPAMIFRDDLPYRVGNFGVADLNVGYWPAAIEAGRQLIGLPLFIKRKPIYEYVFCRAGAGIESPKIWRANESARDSIESPRRSGCVASSSTGTAWMSLSCGGWSEARRCSPSMTPSPK